MGNTNIATVQAPAQPLKRGAFRVLAVNDDKDFCQCCGRSGLKRVVWIEDEQAGEIKHFGTTCATSPAKGFEVDKALQVAITRWNDLCKTRGHRAFRLYRNAGGQFGPMNRYTGVFPALDKLLMAFCRCTSIVEVPQ